MNKSKKEAIIKAAGELLSEYPAEKISVDSIAKKAEIGKGSVYYYFKSKDEILSAVVERSYRTAVRGYFESIKNLPGLNAIEKFRRLFESIIKDEYVDSQKNFLIDLQKTGNPDLREKMSKTAIYEISPVLKELLEEGIAEGTVRTDSPKESAEIIVAVLSSLFLGRRIIDEEKESMKKKLKIFSEVLETCLKTEKGSFDFLYKKELWENIGNLY